MSDLTKRFEEFRKAYSLTNPPPEAAGLPSVFWLALGVVAAGAVSIAIRTYGAFYAAAMGSGLDPVLSRAEAIGAMVFVEGGVVLYEAIRAHRRAVNGQDANLEAQVILAVVLFVAVSAIAGLHQSLALLGDAGTFGRLVLWALALVQGLGGTAALWASGSVLGHIAATSAVERRQWEEGLRRAWERSAAYLEYAAAHGMLQVSNRQRREVVDNAAASIVSNAASIGRPMDNGRPTASIGQSIGHANGQPIGRIGHSGHANPSNGQTPERYLDQPAVRRVLAWALSNGYDLDTMPPVRQVAEALGVSRGTVSNARAVLAWAREMGVDLDALIQEKEV